VFPHIGNKTCGCARFANTQLSAIVVAHRAVPREKLQIICRVEETMGNAVLNIRVEAAGVSLAFTIADGGIAIAPAKDVPLPRAVPKPAHVVAANAAAPPGAARGSFYVRKDMQGSHVEARGAI
jgi:hypothetical protein